MVHFYNTVPESFLHRFIFRNLFILEAVFVILCLKYEPLT